MKHRMVHACALLTVLGLLGLLLACTRQGIEVSDAWIREAPPGSTVLAGYLTIHNHGSMPVTISGVSGEDFSSIEIHRIVTEDGMSRMQRAGALEIPPDIVIDGPPPPVASAVLRFRRASCRQAIASSCCLR